MNKFVLKATAAALALTTTAAYAPLAVFSKAYAESSNSIDFEAAQIALYARAGVRLNEKSVTIAGGAYSGKDAEYTGKIDEFRVSGVKSLGDQKNECSLPDYVGLINSAEPYDFEFEGDKEIFDSAIDLGSSSVYADGDLTINHAALSGDGRIAASGDVNIGLGDNDGLSKAMIMSEDGDITIDAANLKFSGVIYAPNGKVKINAKNIDLVGGIYADSIEINGTSVKISYADFFKISCKAHTEKKIFVNRRDEVTLSGSVSNDAADVKYSAAPSQADKVTITDEDTLAPKLKFSKSGEYDITLTAKIGDKQAVDSVKVVVTDGPVVTYTSTDDFGAGSLESTSGAKDELKLASAPAKEGSGDKTYSLGGESGVSVKAKQSKNAISPSGDKLDLSYSLEGYGKLVTGNGNDVVLCIDNSGSVWDMIPTIKAAALQIIESMGPNDRLGITSLDRLNTPLTSDKETLIAAIDRYNLGGGSDYGNGLRIVNNEMFDEESAYRNKYVFLLADGENGWDYANDDEIAMEQAEIFKQNGTKVYCFEINPFSYDFRDTSTVQDVAINTNGAYKLCPDADAVSKFLLNMADAVYNLAARNVTFSTTVVNADWVKNGQLKKAPDSTVYNDDGSVTLSWNYNTFEIEKIDEIDLGLTTGLIADKGYVQVTRDTKLVSYDSNGEGSVLYLDDIVVGGDACADEGKWTSKTFDSEVDGCPWSYVKWNADYFGDSDMDVYLSTSDDGTNFSGRTKVTNGEDISLKGRYLRTEVEMKASHDGVSPVLYDLTVYSDETEASVVRQGADASIRGAHTVTAGAPVSLWLDVDGKYDSVSKITWEAEGGKLLSDEADPLRRVFSFDKEGDYSVKAIVEAGGVTTEASVVVTVLPKESLWKEIEKQDAHKAVKMSVTDVPAYVTQYQDPLTFNIKFEDPDQVAWVRALYSNDKAFGEGVYRIAQIDETNDYLVTVPIPYNNLAETTVVVDAFDWYGNKVAESRVIKLDRQAPRVGLRYDKSWVYPNAVSNITATFEDDDELASVVLTCNGEEVKLDSENKYAFSNKTPGEYKFELKAVDKAGNESTATTTVIVREDAGLPYVRVNGNNRTVIGNSADLTVTAYDNETGLSKLVVEVQKLDENGEPDGAAETLLSLDSSKGDIEKENKCVFTPKTTGSYRITATATDNEGNVNTGVLNESVVADTNAPNIKIELSKSEVIAGDFTDVTVTVTDDVAVDKVKFFVGEEEAQLDAENKFHYVSDDKDVDKNGVKYVTFKVVATDTSGNERTGTSRLKVAVDDKTAPSVSISGSNRFEYGSNNAYVTVKATDNIGVTSLNVTVNGVAVTPDEQGRIAIDASVMGEYAIYAEASDAAGNTKTAEKTVTVSDTTKPVIKITTDKSSYATGESPVITVEATDNCQLAKVSAKLGEDPISVENGSFTYTITEAAAGTYALTVEAEDASGNVQTASRNITVKDTVAPTLSASVSKDSYKRSETPEIKLEYNDNVAVTKIVANIGGKDLPYDMETKEFAFPEDIVPGPQKVTITAYDAAGNRSESATVEFNISATDDIECPVIEEIAIVPEVVRQGDKVTLTIKATDDSGEVKLIVKKDGAELTEDAVSGTYSFTADEVGDVNITVRAEDPSGNYAEKEAVIKVYKPIENRKITVDAPAFVKPGEQTTITLSSADGDPFDAYELWLGTQDLSAQLSDTADGNKTISFTLDSADKYTFKAIGKDADGYSDEKIFDIQVAGTFDSELQSEEMQNALKQTSETTLDPEMKELAKSFKSPVEAYQYVYDNIAFEPYTNSRRGAVGAYELKRGNDYDQASLLIGFLREMGYPAKYTTANIILTSEQARSLMAVDTFDIAQRLVASSGKTAGIITRDDGSKLLRMEEAFVQVYVPASEIGETDETRKDMGVWVPLDPSIKASALSYDEITPAAEETVDLIADKDSLIGTDGGKDIGYALLCSQFLSKKIGAANPAAALADGPVTVSTPATYAYSRNIVTKEFNRLPSEPDYLFADDQATEFNEIPIAKCDTVEFGVSNRISGKNLGKYKISDVYNKRMTLRFESKDGLGNIFNLGKNEIYYNTFLPALYVDGQLAAKYTLSQHASELEDYMIDIEDEYYFFKDDAWRLGENCTLTTRIITNGRSTTWYDDLNIGSTYSMVFDVGGISENQFMDSLKNASEANGLDVTDLNDPKPDLSAVTDDNYYDEDKIGSYLNFIGNYYFMNCDAYGSMTASMNNIELGGDTKMLMTAYRARSMEDEISKNTTKMVDGRFLIDVSYNTGITFSRSGDTEARNKYMYDVSYMESYYEGSIWEDLLGMKGASTVEVFNEAGKQGIGLVALDSSNVDTELANVGIDAEDAADIKACIEKGYSVMVPEKRVAINDWTGSAYIIADLEAYNHFVFKLSGGTNGGSETEDTDLKGKALMERHANIDPDKVFTGMFTAAQSMYYMLLAYSFGTEFTQAASLLASASGGGVIGAAIGGLKLYSACKHLADIVQYRVDMLEAFYDYCMADEPGEQKAACEELMAVIIAMTKDMADTLKGMFEEDAAPEEEIWDGIQGMFKDLIDAYSDDDGPSTAEEAIEDAFNDDLDSNMNDFVRDLILTARD